MAKLDYLNNHDNQHNHPFFWAPMVGMGDMKAVELTRGKYNRFWVLLSLGALVFTGFVFWRKKALFQN